MIFILVMREIYLGTFCEFLPHRWKLKPDVKYHLYYNRACINVRFVNIFTGFDDGKWTIWRCTVGQSWWKWCNPSTIRWRIIMLVVQLVGTRSPENEKNRYVFFYSYISIFMNEMYLLYVELFCTSIPTCIQLYSMPKLLFNVSINKPTDL